MTDVDELALGARVVARDERTLVLAKPAGRASETRDPDGPDLLAAVRRAGWPQARLPHRLDRVTAGLLVVARDAATVEEHNADVRAGTWRKHYVARIGAAGPDDATLLGTHRRYLRRRGRRATVVRSGGQPARQVHEVVAADPALPDARQVLVLLHTGRYHQVRVVLADLGAPLLGDEAYGGRPWRGGPWLTHVRLGGVRLDGAPTAVTLDRPPHPLAPAVRDALAAAAAA